MTSFRLAITVLTAFLASGLVAGAPEDDGYSDFFVVHLAPGEFYAEPDGNRFSLSQYLGARFSSVKFVYDLNYAVEVMNAAERGDYAPPAGFCNVDTVARIAYTADYLIKPFEDAWCAAGNMMWLMQKEWRALRIEPRNLKQALQTLEQKAPTDRAKPVTIYLGAAVVRKKRCVQLSAKFYYGVHVYASARPYRAGAFDWPIANLKQFQDLSRQGSLAPTASAERDRFPASQASAPDHAARLSTMIRHLSETKNPVPAQKSPIQTAETSPEGPETAGTPGPGSPAKAGSARRRTRTVLAGASRRQRNQQQEQQTSDDNQQQQQQKSVREQQKKQQSVRQKSTRGSKRGKTQRRA